MAIEPGPRKSIIGPDRGEVPDIYVPKVQATGGQNPDEIISRDRLASRIKRANRWMARHPGWKPEFTNPESESKRRKAAAIISEGLDSVQAMGYPITDDLLRPGIPQPDYYPFKSHTIGTTHVKLEQIPSQPSGEDGTRVRLTAYVSEKEYQANGGFPTERRVLKKRPDGSIEHNIYKFEGVEVSVGNRPMYQAKDTETGPATDQEAATFTQAHQVRPVVIEANYDTAMAFAKAHLRGYNKIGRKTQHLSWELVAAGASINADPEGWEQSVHFPVVLAKHIPNFSAKLRSYLGIIAERWISPFNQQEEVRITARGDSKAVTGLFDSFSIIPEDNVFFHKDGTVQQPRVSPSRLALVA